MKSKIALLIFCLTASNGLLKAQTADNKTTIHLSQNLRDYNISLLNNKFTSFDSALSQTYRIGLQRYISRFWNVSVGINNGFLLNQYNEGQLVRKTFASGVDADIFFKFNNGNRIKENGIVAPFLSFGYDISYLNGFKKAGLNPWNVSNNYGIGVNMNVSKSNAISMQVQLNQQLGGEFTTHLNYRLGYAYTFGINKNNQKELPKKKLPDSDKDGIADVDDKCPDIAGFPEYAGCNPEEYADTALRLSFDSLKNEVNGIKMELDSIKVEIVGVRQILEKYIDEEKSKTPVTQPVTKNEAVTTPPVQTYTPPVEAYKPPAETYKPPVETTKPVKPIVQETLPERNVEGKAYYVVAISTLQASLAKDMAKELAKDYPVVEILPQANGFYRVGIYATRTRSEALKVLDYAKTHGITMAWLSLE